MVRTKRGQPPGYCKHKQSGQAYVTLNREQIMLGQYDTPESRQEYTRLLAEWEANGRRLPDYLASDGYAVQDLYDDYIAHCKVYYRKPDGTATSETNSVKLSFREALELYADIPAAEFGLRELKAVRHAMIAAKLSRQNVNDRVGRITRAFGWAVEELKIPAVVFGALRSLKRLKKFRSEAHETEPVQPVAWEHVERVLPHVSRQVRAMILLQWYSACRPGEIVQLRPCDLDRKGAVWIYRPQRHKTEHHGKERLIGLGPESQQVLREFLDRVPRPRGDAPLFSPAAAMREKTRQRREQRETPLYDSHMRRNETQRKTSPKRSPNDSYDVASYRRAIERGCKLAGVPVWSPNRLRHSAATRLRQELGIEAARVVLGHSSSVTSEIYAQADQLKALEVMGRLG